MIFCSLGGDRNRTDNRYFFVGSKSIGSRYFLIVGSKLNGQSVFRFWWIKIERAVGSSLLLDQNWTDSRYFFVGSKSNGQLAFHYKIEIERTVGISLLDRNRTDSRHFVIGSKSNGQSAFRWWARVAATALQKFWSIKIIDAENGFDFLTDGRAIKTSKNIKKTMHGSKRIFEPHNTITSKLKFNILWKNIVS
jgi:hypothetical protein